MCLYKKKVDMTDPHRTPFLEAAEAPPVSRWRRFERLIFRQRPLNIAPAFTAQSDDPRQFQPTEEGSGNFGRWIIDEAGLPAYQYELDQRTDPRASYPNTEELDRRDHWHQIGNHRITALASNDGTIQVYLCDRGGVFLNRFEAWEYDRRHFYLTKTLYAVARFIIRRVTNLFRSGSRAAPFAQAQGVGVENSVPPRGAVTPEVLAQIRAQQISAQNVRIPPRDPAAVPHTYGGGFSYVDDGRQVWSTAFRYQPKKAKTRRVFGIGYFETETIYRNVRMKRRVYAPYGDTSAVIADVEIENLGASPVDLRHYEYWDVNVHQLRLEWLRGGSFAPSSDRARRDLNRFFSPTVKSDRNGTALRFRQSLRQPAPQEFKPPEAPCDVDWSPADIFLADLSGTPDAVYINKRAFFGSGGARQPDAVWQRRDSDSLDTSISDDPMPYCLVLRRDVHLNPGARCTLRYAYGRTNESLDFLNPFRQAENLFIQTLDAWKDNLVYFSTRQDPVLQREMAWHAYNLASATVYSDFYKTHIVPQGSAYLFLHGADGAPRDQALYTLPMTYLNPKIAQDMLRLIMRITDGQTGQISYSFAGHGFLSDGLGIHPTPSDLDLFFLLALCEYLSATGDLDFLNEEVPFYPPDQPPISGGIRVLDHVRTAVRHVFEGVGIGDHGLIKIGSGDWSDSIVLETALRDGVGPFGVTYVNSKQHGESIPNTQMALYVLPLLAAILKEHDPELIEYLCGTPNRLESLREAVQRQWNPKGWYNRAILRGFNNDLRVIDRFDLEAQPWALIAGLAGEREATLIENIDQFLDRPSPIGASLLAGGMVWPAVSQLLTWGYARSGRAHLAWRSLNRNTFAMHSHIYPNIWFNTWSGPDGINGTASDHPGGTWSSPITPMTDFPVMNANQDAMALLGLLRVCGVEPAPTGDGLLIDPHLPREHFVLDTPLLRLEVLPRQIVLTYHAIVSGSRTLYFCVPPNATEITVKVINQTLLTVQDSSKRVVVPLTFNPGQAVPIEITWK